MSKIVSLTIAHYGADYIGYALRAVEPYVDEVYVLYTPTPSHGTGATLPCPDSESDMEKAILFAGIGNKLKYIKGTWPTEGAHRNQIYDYVSEGDLIVVADADEIWDAKCLQAGLTEMRLRQTPMWYKVRMTNLWRSFGWACTDPMTQDRIIRVGGNSQEIAYSPISAPPEYPDIWHFGYARKPIDVAYKMTIHGHVTEFFPNWFAEKFLTWTPDNGVADVHPTCQGFWMPKPLSREFLPESLRLHPYYNAGIIE